MAKSARMYKEAYGDETIYLTTDQNYDYRGAGWRAGDKTLLLNVAMTDGNYIRLPEATTDNLGLHVRIIFGLSPADNIKIGFVTTKLVGGAVGISDASQGLSTANGFSQISAVGTSNLAMVFDADGSTDDGSGFPGTVVDIYYTGAENVAMVHATLIGDVDSATGANFFTTATVIA